MRRIMLLIAAFTLLFAVCVPTVAYAAFDPFEDACSAGGGDSVVCKSDGKTDPIIGKNGALVAVVSILAAVAGIVSIISLIWGGVKYITSDGDSGKVSSAKQAVVAALIGLVIAAMARPIVVFVVGKI